MVSIQCFQKSLKTLLAIEVKVNGDSTRLFILSVVAFVEFLVSCAMHVRKQQFSRIWQVWLN